MLIREKCLTDESVLVIVKNEQMPMLTFVLIKIMLTKYYCHLFFFVKLDFEFFKKKSMKRHIEQYLSSTEKNDSQWR